MHKTIDFAIVNVNSITMQFYLCSHLPMENQSKTSKRSKESNTVPGKLPESFYMATLGFLTITLSYLLYQGTLSLFLGYNTEVSFLRVTSTPFENRYWSSGRVLTMYLLPAVIYLFAGTGIAYYLHWAAKKVSILYWYLYWCMLFSIAFATSQFIISPLASLHTKSPLYQGVVVAMNWWGVELGVQIGFAFVAIAINLLMGFITYKILMQLSPVQSVVFSKSNQQLVVFRYFIAPLILLLPLSLVLTFPYQILNILPVFLCIVLWLPGYIIKTQDGYRLEGKVKQAANITFGYIWPIAIGTLLLMIRVFL